MNRRHLLAASGAVLGAMAGCVSTAEGTRGVPSPGLQIGTDVDEADVDALVEGNTTFALRFHEAIVERDPEENHLVSPLSISIALAMTWAGARGTTETEMSETLQFPFEQDTLHLAMGGLLTALSDRAYGDDPGWFDLFTGDEDSLDLALANRIWPQDGLALRDEFLETLDTRYAGEPQPLDFAGDSAGARDEINSWVADQTNDLIDELLPAGSIDANTKLVLTNAIYLLANWYEQFDPDDTTDEPFTSLGGATTDVPMMSQTADFPYVREEGYQAIELPYVGEELSMVVVLPDQDGFEAFEASLTNEQLKSIFDSFTEREISISLPQFTFETNYSLQSVLSDLGMGSAFGAGADFSGMIEGGGLWIDDVYHDAYIAVDEEGTEAAAATGVVMTDSAPPAMRVDRPFVFLIRDRPTDAILFLGRMVKPAE